MSFGALAGALNTMYASVDARMREIATLRAIGFGGLPAFIGTMIESLLLSAIGGIAGAVFTFVAFDGISAATLGSNFTQVVFSLKLTPALVMQGIVLSLVIGLQFQARSQMRYGIDCASGVMCTSSLSFW
jgi:putative ABC transport system permease protein